MITEGLLYTVIGMGMVFAFLIILIWVMNLLGKFVALLDKRFPGKEAASHGHKHVDNTAVAIAIAAAKNFAK